MLSFQLVLRQRLAGDDAERDRARLRHGHPLPLLRHLGRDLPHRRQEHRTRIVLVLGIDLNQIVLILNLKGAKSMIVLI